VPWATSLHTLQTICRLIEWPAQLIDWLQQRSILARQQVIRSTDELDLFIAHLENSLNLDYEEADAVLLPSGTDDIAAWVLYKEGIRTRPAPRPQQRFNDVACRRVLRQIHEARDDGWLERALAVIEANRRPAPRVSAATMSEAQSVMATRMSR